MDNEAKSVREYLFKYPNDKTNCSTKARKEIMLENEYITIDATLYKIIFQNLQGGIWSASLKK